MSLADKNTYLSEISDICQRQWPENRSINIVCHGHSVPAGYFATPNVETLNAYPHLLQVALKKRFPYAVINIIVTAIGGEHSESGAARFADEVLCHRPDLITIDYGLNDRGIGLERAQTAWRSMIEQAMREKIKVMLLSPSLDNTQSPDYTGDDRAVLEQHADQIAALAAEHGLAFADSFKHSHDYISTHALSDIMSWSNHPNRLGHDLITEELLRWFPGVS